MPSVYLKSLISLIFFISLLSLRSQIAGSVSKSAFIYQDIISSGFPQVLAYDSAVNATNSPGNPPSASYQLATNTGSLSPVITASPGQIIRWQLWGERTLPSEWYQLDVKALLPIQETLSLSSLDFINSQRTRVGKPYSVAITIGGMPTYGSGATETGEVYLGLSALVDGNTFGFRSLSNYTSLTSPGVSDSVTPGSLEEYNYNAWFLVNGTYNISNLAPSQPGTETWLIDWIETAEWASAQVDQSSMLVLPSPSVSPNRPVNPVFQGDPDSLPLLDLAFNNLYPGSLTIFQILDAKQNLLATLTVNDDTGNGTIISSHSLAHFLVNLSQYLTQAGTYTFEAWTAEPFGDGIATIAGATTPAGYTWSPLSLAASSISVSFTANVRGTIITN